MQCAENACMPGFFGIVGVNWDISFSWMIVRELGVSLYRIASVFAYFGNAWAFLVPVIGSIHYFSTKIQKGKFLLLWRTISWLKPHSTRKVPHLRV